MTTIIEAQEIIQKLTNAKITQIDIAEALGCGRANISLRSKNNSSLSFDEIKKIEQHFNISLNKQQTKGEDVILDFFPDVFGSCGNGVFALSELRDQIAVPKKAFFTAYNPIKKYSVIRARGNSMEPAIYDNDYLIIEHSDGEQIIDNRPYIFCYNDEIFIKKLAKNVNQLIITSENKSYDVIKLTGDEINKVLIIGQVVGLMRDLR